MAHSTPKTHLHATETTAQNSIYGAPKFKNTEDKTSLLRLIKAEREISLLRWLGMAVWFFVLLRIDFESNVITVWGIYFTCLGFTIFAQFRLSKLKSVRVSAWLTMVGDPLLAAAICSVTGGVDSLLLPFLYFTSLAAAFRFGTHETLLILGFNFILSGVLYFYATPSGTEIDKLFIVIFYNSFAAVIGTMFAGWAQENLSLAETHAQALQRAHSSVRSLLHQLINVQETERKRIADDLHDRMGGRLFTLQQGIDNCKSNVAEDSPLYSQLNLLTQETRACGDDVRLLMNELRPTILDDLGIAETLSEYISKMNEIVPFKIDLNIDSHLRNWRSKEDALVFRLVQEAIFNIRKHAKAENVGIFLDVDENHVVLKITDDGVGFDSAAVESGHYGLLTMEERAQALGGTLSISSIPNQGTTVTARLPM